MFAQSSGTIENRRAMRRFEDVAKTDNFTENSQQAIFDDGGFCTICEMHYQYLSLHMCSFHKNDDSEGPECYKIYNFEAGINFMAPAGVFTIELAKCEICHGVFYKHRVGNHGCKISDGMIDEGVGTDAILDLRSAN
ncbi:Hypothetical predicted protein [Cloeon dipterum]|uniref:Uncharacterized protein n=1 Tax=Cloeon dipterum TaxID=197152 RepID=A0A8S1DXR4_9INSE|nr:Hypothetical predicted protein [Cloeon dipterum]